MVAQPLSHYYTHGDVYEALEACLELEMLLGRLRRQQLLEDDAWRRMRESLDEIRCQVERRLPAAG